jgi:hypothetical protein
MINIQQSWKQLKAKKRENILQMMGLIVNYKKQKMDTLLTAPGFFKRYGWVVEEILKANWSFVDD